MQNRFSTMPIAPEALVVVLLAVALGLRALLRKRAAPSLLPVPPGLPALLAVIPHLQVLEAVQRQQHVQAVEQFLREKHFTGCGGFIITDEVRVLIAGLACLLVLRPKAKVFPELRSVLVYPGPFLVPQEEPDDLGLVYDEPVEQIGESWNAERVILSWPDVQAALAGGEINVVAHEFAHQLDDESPEADGAPLLTDYARWAEVMEREYARLLRHRRPPVLDPYGAENPAEFFAVVTEAYFQRGAELQQHHTELYELLRDYYGLDTARLSLP